MRRTRSVVAGAAPSWLLPAVAAVVVVLLRLPSLHASLSADEGGFLVVGAQWHPGSSLYGDYWVDRPPLLVGLFALAAWAGGVVALRLLGCVAAAAAVLLAARLGRQVGGPAGRVGAVVAAAAFVSTPMFDARQVSGELLALPFVLAGLVAVLQARPAPATVTPTAGRRPPAQADLRWLAAGGALTACAFLVKQNFVDVAAFTTVLALAGGLGTRSARALTRAAAAFWGGALVTVVGAVAGAATRGTDPVGLWHAVVVFRFQASQVIAGEASSATTERLHRYPSLVLGSGAVLLVALLVVRVLRTRPVDPLGLAALALLGWETVAVLGGGSYWLHYLMGLVPALTLAAAYLSRAAPARHPTGQSPISRPRITLAEIALGWAVVSTAIAVGTVLAHPARAMPSAVAGEWLEHHRLPGDTAIVAYGQPNILAESGTTSPYADLWSLPVRVRDPQLTRMASVLNSDDAPDWVLVYKHLRTWAVDARAARVAVREHYRRVADVCGYRVYLHDGVHRPVATVNGRTTRGALTDPSGDLPGRLTARPAGVPLDHCA